MLQASSSARLAVPLPCAFQTGLKVPAKRPRTRHVLQPVAAAGDKPGQKAKDPGPVSGDYKNRLRDEYVGFGGAPNKPMGSNYFLWIIVIISALALASYLAGAV